MFLFKTTFSTFLFVFSFRFAFAFLFSLFSFLFPYMVKAVLLHFREDRQVFLVLLAP